MAARARKSAGCSRFVAGGNHNRHYRFFNRTLWNRPRHNYVRQCKPSEQRQANEISIGQPVQQRDLKRTQNLRRKPNRLELRQMHQVEDVIWRQPVLLELRLCHTGGFRETPGYFP